MSENETGLDVKIDLGEMTFGDLDLLSRLQTDEISIIDLIPTLNRIVVGGVNHIKIRELPTVTQAIWEAIGDRAKAKN